MKRFDSITVTGGLSKKASPFTRSLLIVAGLILLGMTVVDSVCQASSGWIYGTPMPRARYAGGAAEVGDKIYILGGESGTAYDYVEEVDRYDPANGTWEANVTQIPHARTSFATALVGTSIYCMGGWTGSAQSYVDIYDTQTGTWSSGSGMPAARRNCEASAIGTDIYVFGGAGPGTTVTPLYDTIFKYDTTSDQWTTLNPMSTGRNGHAVTALDGYIYIACGDKGPDNQDAQSVSDLDRYDPATESWSQMTPSPTVRRHFELLNISGNLFAIGGYNESFINSSVEYYDVDRNKWYAVDNLNEGRLHYMTAGWAGQIFVFGGSTEAGVSTSMEIYQQPCFHTIDKPHTFVPGTVAKSSEVNENFDVLYNKVNELQCESNNLGSQLVQAGTGTTDGTTYATITFATPYSSPPIVVVSTDQEDNRFIVIQTRTSTGFTVRSVRPEDNLPEPNIPFTWMATLPTQ